MFSVNMDKALIERQKYVNAFNSTMIKIWKEQISLLNVIDTGALYRSVVALGTHADGKYYSVTFSQSFNLYGIYVDYGTGRNTPKGNPGDIGRDNPRGRKRWFSLKHFVSVMNIKEFYADNLGKECADVISNALTRDLSKRFVT